MKLSLSMYSLVAAVHAGRMDLMGFVDYAAAQGVAGVELLDIFWTDAEREIPLMKRRIADAGMEVAVYSISNDFIQPKASDRDQELADLTSGESTSPWSWASICCASSAAARATVSRTSRA